MFRRISQVRPFVVALSSVDNLRDTLATHFAAAMLDVGGDVVTFAREFSKQVLAELRRIGAERLARSATVRISECKRIYIAASNGDKLAAKVLNGRLSISEYFKEQRLPQSKGSKPFSATRWAKQQVAALSKLSKQQRSKALAMLARQLKAAAAK